MLRTLFAAPLGWRYFFMSSLHVPAPQPALAVARARGAAAGATAFLFVRSMPASIGAERATLSSSTTGGAALGAAAVAAGAMACGAGVLDETGSGDADEGADAFEQAASDAIVSAAMNVSTESFGISV